MMVKRGYNIHSLKTVKRDLRETRRRGREISMSEYLNTTPLGGLEVPGGPIVNDDKPIPVWRKVAAALVPGMFLVPLLTSFFDDDAPISMERTYEAVVEGVSPHVGFSNSTANDVFFGGLEAQMSERFNETLNDSLSQYDGFNLTAAQEKAVFTSAYGNASGVFDGAKNITGSVKRAFWRAFNGGVSEGVEEIVATRSSDSSRADNHEVKAHNSGRGQNNPPVIEGVLYYLYAYVGEKFYLDVNASDLDNDTLTYSDNTSLFEIDEKTGEVKWTPEEKDIGSYYIKFSVDDGRGGIDETRSTLQVERKPEKNNPPVLEDIPDILYAYVRELPFYMDIDAWDPDNDTLTYSENTDLFEIDTRTGEVYWVPEEKDVGTYKIKFSVNDFNGGVDEEEVTLEVICEAQKNRPPVLEDMPSNLFAQVGKEFYLNVNAWDPENDTLTYSDNTSLFEIDEKTGEVYWIPEEKDIGTYKVSFSASDGKGGIDEMESILEVTAKPQENHPPVLEDIPEEFTIPFDEPFYLDINASDTNKDNLTYLDNTDLFDIDSETGKIYWTPKKKDVGTYKIKLTVSDSRGNIDEKEIILNVEEPVDETPYEQPSKERPSNWIYDYWYWLAGGVASALTLTLIYKKKKKQHKDTKEEYAPPLNTRKKGSTLDDIFRKTN